MSTERIDKNKNEILGTVIETFLWICVCMSYGKRFYVNWCRLGKICEKGKPKYYLSCLCGLTFISFICQYLIWDLIWLKIRSNLFKHWRQVFTGAVLSAWTSWFSGLFWISSVWETEWDCGVVLENGLHVSPPASHSKTHINFATRNGKNQTKLLYCWLKSGMLSWWSNISSGSDCTSAACGCGRMRQVTGDGGRCFQPGVSNCGGGGLNWG